MKTFNKILLGIGAVATMGLGSCTGDLDLLPTDPSKITAGTFQQDPDASMDRVMGDVYLQFATYGANGNASVSGTDGGMTTFQRGLFILEEIPTDEANWLPTADADYGLIQYGIAAPNNTIMYGVYSRLMINAAVCTDFIQSVQEGKFGQLSPAGQARSVEFVRQARILRAACYFYLVDLFGNVPFMTDETKMGEVPAQKSRAEIFNNVTAELERVVAEYGGDAKQYWSYVGLEVAEALLVKFYLNAEVYTGTPQWAKCIDYANRIINRHKGTGFEGTGLAESYSALFAANNRQYANGGTNAVSENLWIIPADVEKLDSYANAMFMIAGWIGPDQKGKFNTADAWKCMTTRPEFASIFEWNDAKMTDSNDTRVKYWCTQNDGFTFDNLQYDQAAYGDNGYLAIKYTNYNLGNDGLPTGDQPNPTTFLNNDYAVIRLAEIYLSAAEAMMKSGSDQATALQYVNYIRKRAGVEAWTDLTLDKLYQERARELYTENNRRTDLIRAGKWISGYNWTWKNQTPKGSNFPAHYNLYPLPSTIVSLAKLAQNPGYSGSN